MLTSTFLLLAISLLAQTSANLKLNLEKNKVYHLNYSSEQSISQTVNGNRQNVEIQINYSISLKMLDITPDFLITEVHFDSLITNTNQMGKKTIISSVIEGNIKSSEAADVMSAVMNHLTKSPLFVKLDFTGKPTEIINAKMVSDLVMKDTSDITIKGAVAATLKNQISGVVSENSLKSMVEVFTAYLPGKQASKGDSWNVSQKTNAGGMPLVVDATYHVDGINSNTANITAEANIKAPENAVPIKSGSATVSYDNLQGTSRTSYVIDINTGLIVDLKTKTHVAGNLGVSAPGVNMQIPMEIDGESTVKAIK